ncbi:MAG: hypothetical protein ACRDTC_15360 [Pseudonocardiaceae bacterium]
MVIVGTDLAVAWLHCGDARVVVRKGRRSSAFRDCGHDHGGLGKSRDMTAAPMEEAIKNVAPEGATLPAMTDIVYHENTPPRWSIKLRGFRVGQAVVYVDGMNLYHGIKAKHGRKYL